MPELAKWPEVERLENPLDIDGTAIAPVEIRFQVKPEAEAEWPDGLVAECSIGGYPAASPGAAVSFRQWEKDSDPTLYCYTLVRNLTEGQEVKLSVRPRSEKPSEEEPEALWEKGFRVRLDGDKITLE